MKSMNVGACGINPDPTYGVKFDGHIIGDDSVTFHFACTGYLDNEGRNFECADEFADFSVVMNACDQDSELGIRLYNAFKSAVYNMLLGFHTQTLSHEHFTLVTIDEEDGFTKLEVKLMEEEA